MQAAPLRNETKLVVGHKVDPSVHYKNHAGACEANDGEHGQIVGLEYAMKHAYDQFYMLAHLRREVTLGLVFEHQQGQYTDQD
jgi:hypothetical protein